MEVHVLQVVEGEHLAGVSHPKGLHNPCGVVGTFHTTQIVTGQCVFGEPRVIHV
jgi:hypothetical protein